MRTERAAFLAFEQQMLARRCKTLEQNWQNEDNRADESAHKPQEAPLSTTHEARTGVLSRRSERPRNTESRGDLFRMRLTVIPPLRKEVA